MDHYYIIFVCFLESFCSLTAPGHYELSLCGKSCVTNYYFKMFNFVFHGKKIAANRFGMKSVKQL